jgi:hypothetical protein
VPECVGLSPALFDDGLTFTLAASDEEIAALDAVQYLDGGPCVQAAHDDETIEADPADPVDEERWRMYAQATAAAGGGQHPDAAHPPRRSRDGQREPVRRHG